MATILGIEAKNPQDFSEKNKKSLDLFRLFWDFG